MAEARSDGGAVVITGASTGIGRACALELAGRGHRVFAGVRRREDGDALRAAGGESVTPLSLEVTSSESIQAAVKSVEAELGDQGLLGLVNNAGISGGGPIEYLDLDDLRALFEVNFFGAVAVTRAFLPLIRRGRGRVVNMSSIGGRVASPMTGPYNASKFALEGLSDSLRVELSPWNIPVSLVEPGAIATPIWDKAGALTDQLVEALPAEGKARYEPFIGGVRWFIERGERTAIPPERVAKAVTHALTSRRPRTRYLVGTDAHVQALLGWLLPDRWLDAITLRFLGIRRQA